MFVSNSQNLNQFFWHECRMLNAWCLTLYSHMIRSIILNDAALLLLNHVRCTINGYRIMYISPIFPNDTNNCSKKPQSPQNFPIILCVCNFGILEWNDNRELEKRIRNEDYLLLFGANWTDFGVRLFTSTKHSAFLFTRRTHLCQNNFALSKWFRKTGNENYA